MIQSFAAIDFETANQARSSVCSVGVVIVEHRQVVHKVYQLILPTPHYYSYWNTQVHGLTEHDTQDAQPFPQVWQAIAPLLQGLPLVAHNSPFDEGCLRAVHQVYGMVYPTDYRFYCTCRSARKALPLLPNHKLGTVAAYCGFDLTHHHHALADAEACAAIALELL